MDLSHVESLKQLIAVLEPMDDQQRRQIIDAALIFLGTTPDPRKPVPRETAR